ncbi:MAG: hypothetical protein RL186_546 [Pseudomonadota bacterium]|jgi:predicted metal-dependent hydrolase
MRVDPVARQLVLSGPPRVRQRDISAFVSQNLDWIAARLDALPQAAPFQDGSEILLRGEMTRLVRKEGRGAPLWIAGDAGQAPHLVICASSAQFDARTRAALKAFAHADALAHSNNFAPKLGKAPTALRLRDTKSRWGSCNSNGQIMLSWRLIGAPPRVLEYVVAHEMAHLLELNHSRRFWSHVETLMPDWQTARAWLKTHGARLHALGSIGSAQHELRTS